MSPKPWINLFDMAGFPDIDVDARRQSALSGSMPKELNSDPWLVLPLSSEPESELLFGKQISFARQEVIEL